MASPTPNICGGVVEVVRVERYFDVFLLFTENRTFCGVKIYISTNTRGSAF